MRNNSLFGIVIGGFLLALSVFGLFQIKYKVLDLRKDLSEINRQLEQEKEAIHVLKAEWAYLNQPDRLKRLASKHLKLEPVTVAQMHRTEKNMPTYLAASSKKNDNGLKKVKIIDLAELNKPSRNRNILKAKATRIN
jgi:cell division protein FtsL